LAARFESVEILCAGGGGVDAAHQSESGAVDAARIVVNPGEAGLRRAIQPPIQFAVVGPGSSGGLPVQFNVVRRVSKGRFDGSDRLPDSGNSF